MLAIEPFYFSYKLYRELAFIGFKLTTVRDFNPVFFSHQSVWLVAHPDVQRDQFV